jgi:hypothetical protein
VPLLHVVNPRIHTVRQRPDDQGSSSKHNCADDKDLSVRKIHVGTAIITAKLDTAISVNSAVATEENSPIRPGERLLQPGPQQERFPPGSKPRVVRVLPDFIGPENEAVFEGQGMRNVITL